MTPEELKEIEERYSMSLKTFSLNNLARLGVDVRGEILDLLAYIKELQYEIEMLSASPDETSSHCGTFKDELRKDMFNKPNKNRNTKKRTKKRED